MDEYLFKFKGVADTLATAGHVLFEKDHILHLLVGLSSKNDPLTISIISKTERFKFEDVAALLMTHETRIEQRLHNLVEINTLDGYTRPTPIKTILLQIQ